MFGAGFLNVVSTVTLIVKRALHPGAWAAGVALLTVVFSLGQTLGPLLSGALADASGSLISGLALSAALLLASGLIALLQRDITRPG